SNITVTITDAGSLTATESFTLTVSSINDAPAITAIDDQITNEDTAITSISLTVTDIETAGCSHGITFASSVTSLIPVENISYTCSADTFYLSITPVSNQSGSSNITITITDAGSLTATESFTLTVSSINDTPAITTIDNQITNEDTAITSISFTVTDVETAGCSHGITFDSSDTALIPVENISYTCSAGIFYLSITPVSNQSGSSNITVTITDAGSLTATESFTLTVSSINDAPVITTIDNQITNEDTAISSLSFTVTDAETAGCAHGITFASSDTSLVPVENISYTCSAGVFYLSITPVTNQSGNSTITITVTDAGSLTATESFILTVTSVNDTPVIGTINGQTTNEDTQKQFLFTLSDIESGACGFNVSFASSNPSLITDITYYCENGNHEITAIPIPDQNGIATITVTATDSGGLTTATTFDLTVTSINDTPQIGLISNQTIDEDTTIEALELTATDAETVGCSLGISIVSSNTSLISNSSISYTCSGDTFYLSLTPTLNQTGNATISITVTDPDAMTATQSFALTVTSVNDTPVISTISDLNTNEDTAIN
ncbi:hypothetical protein MHK_001955, partial [Candidatus Magnetomorum sp. HK-1]